ncbi:MAG: hypothetical protein AB7O66_11010 [Limisphaerales bacterium]
MPSLLRYVAVVLLSLSLGLHWAVLQSVAWTTMLAKRVQAGSVWDAVQSTFDGSSPCRLCLAVKAGKAESDENQNLPQWKLAKPDVFPADAETGWLRVDPAGCPLTRAGEERRDPRSQAPESPPPRRA